MNIKQAKTQVMTGKFKMFLPAWEGVWIEWRGGALVYCGPKRTKDSPKNLPDDGWEVEALPHRTFELVDYAMEMLQVMRDAGYDLMPLGIRSKVPSRAGWRTDDMTPWMDNHMRDWLRIGGNVGVRLAEDDLVIDVDPRMPNNGEASYAFLESMMGGAHIETLGTTKVMSGREDGGRHLFFKKPYEIRTNINMRSLPGIDFKRYGGYTVAPGSIHPDTGKMYIMSTARIVHRTLDRFILDVITKTYSDIARDSLDSPLSAEDVEKLLSALDPRWYGQGGRYHGADDRWTSLAMACHHGNPSALPAFLAWCAKDPQYGEAHSDSVTARWDSFDASKGGRMWTYRTLLQEVVKAGRADLVARLGHTYESAAEDFGDAWDDSLNDEEFDV